MISPAQFVDFNARIGGADMDLNIVPERTAADPIALERLYRTGAIDSANNLNKVAIIDLRGPDPGAFHDVYRTYAMRARLERNFGTAANQILWRGKAPLIGDPSYADDAVFAVDRWLARVHADHRRVPLARKIIQDRPDTVAPRCTDGNGKDVPSSVCDQTVSAYGTPRQGGDGPLSEDVMKCRLKPMRREDYPVTFTDAQWAAAPAGVPGRCLRLHEARREPARRLVVAHLPDAARARDLRREAARQGAAVAPDPLARRASSRHRAAGPPPRPAPPPPARAAGRAGGAGRPRSAGSRARAGGRRSATRRPRTSSGG